MHTIGLDGRKLLEAICFEGVKETIETAPIKIAEFDERKPKNLVDALKITNSIIRSIKESYDYIGKIEGYDLGKFAVGDKNAIYVAAIVEGDDAGNRMLNIVAKGNEHSIKRFKKEIGNYDKCVSCNAITPYKKSTPVHERENYVEGAGQLCNSCNTKIYGKEQDE